MTYSIEESWLKMPTFLFLVLYNVSEDGINANIRIYRNNDVGNTQYKLWYTRYIVVLSKNIMI